MPTSPIYLIEAAGCGFGGIVPWGTRPPEQDSGIYVVSLSEDPQSVASLPTAPVDPSQVQELLDAVPGLTLDNQSASAKELAERLASMWLPDESVVYIGKATSLASRVGQYYGTPLGARSPHAGGWPIKTLSNLDDLWVHWAVSRSPEESERLTLRTFMDNVSDETRSRLCDPSHPYPFANLTGPLGRKNHGIRGARGGRGRQAPPPARISSTAGHQEPREPRREHPMSTRTQRITATDIANGRIRIPSASKHLFPGERTQIEVRIRSTQVTARWDPRFGPPERSGTIGIGRQLLPSLVQPNETLMVTLDGEVVVIG